MLDGTNIVIVIEHSVLGGANIVIVIVIVIPIYIYNHIYIYIHILIHIISAERAQNLQVRCSQLCLCLWPLGGELAVHNRRHHEREVSGCEEAHIVGAEPGAGILDALATAASNG